MIMCAFSNSADIKQRCLDRLKSQIALGAPTARVSHRILFSNKGDPFDVDQVDLDIPQQFYGWLDLVLGAMKPSQQRKYIVDIITAIPVGYNMHLFVLERSCCLFDKLIAYDESELFDTMQNGSPSSAMIASALLFANFAMATSDSSLIAICSLALNRAETMAEQAGPIPPRLAYRLKMAANVLRYRLEEALKLFHTESDYSLETEAKLGLAFIQKAEPCKPS